MACENQMQMRGGERICKAAMVEAPSLLICFHHMFMEVNHITGGEQDRLNKEHDRHLLD